MSDDKTEQPTPKRLREAREKGDLCKSQEIATALTVFVLVAYLVAMSDSIYEKVSAMFLVTFDRFHLPYTEAIGQIIYVVFDVFIWVVIPIVVLVMAMGIIGNLVQVGFLFSIKVFVISFAVYYVLSKYMTVFFKIQTSSLENLWGILGQAVKDLLIFASGAFCVIAGLDYMFQRWQYTKQHMMSKDEVKREYKEMEGDPHIKSKRKQLHQELLAQNSMGNVRKAKVLVTNPTHYAVALDYEKDKTPLPVILAKGEGFLAQRMIKVAEEEGIPIMRNVPLARSLYADGTENAYIPADLIKPVAEVLKWVQSLEKR